MNTEKLEQAKKELRAGFNSIIVFILPELKKDLPRNAFTIDEPKNVKEWLTITDYHPDRGVIIAVSKEYEPFFKVGEVVYLDGTRRNTFTAILHDREVYFKVSPGNISCSVEGYAATLNLEKKENEPTILIN